jgi:1-acyl-sn-glycerol-3-phosphate acyltransferase
MACRRGAPFVVFPPRFPSSAILYHVFLAAVRLVDVTLFGLRVHGREHLRGVCSAILVSNHTLVLDPGLLAHALRPRRVYFTMLEETALIPILGTFVRLLGGVPLVRGSLSQREGLIDEALRQLGLVHFFPEGECYLRNQQIQPFRRGAFHAALHRGLPVIPVTTVLRERAWPLWRRLGLPPRVTVVIGGPRQPAGVPGGTCASGNPSATSASGTRSIEDEWARRVRVEMQAVIDREGGCKTIGRGQMPRLGLHQRVAAV